MEITLSSIVRWIFGLIFLLVGLSSLFDGNFIVFLVAMLIAVVCIPVIANSIENKLNISMSGAVRFVLVFVLLICFGAVNPDDTAATTPDNIQTSDSSAKEIEATPEENESSTKATPEETESSIETNPEETESSTESSIYKVGDRVVVGDIAYTITNVRTANSVGDEYLNAKADGIFVIVDMTIENLGKESSTISSSYVKIVDSQGRTFESDTDAWIYIENNILARQIQPGLPVKGQAIYDVPKGITCDLQVTDSLWSSETKSISLGTI